MDCPGGIKADKCMEVHGIGMIAVTKESETVFEGSLTGEGIDDPISVVVIVDTADSSALVCILKQIVLFEGFSYLYLVVIVLKHLCVIFLIGQFQSSCLSTL